MLDQADLESTLPTLVASLPASCGAQKLYLTVVFHPDTSRIGEIAEVPERLDTVWVLGRSGPAFARTGRDTAPLADPHVSRRALEFRQQGDGLLLRRHGRASRCQVDGEELVGDLTLTRERLARGVALLLSHGIVLLLRRTGEVTRETPHSCTAALLGSGATMARVRQRLTEAAGSDLDVLIRGETGTGKELAAGAVHAGSRRADASLVNVNMAAIPGELAAAALFGSTRGAYTGSQRSQQGFFQRAQGGSLFLDEIGDLAATLQPQLLRALQQREIQPVGGAVQRVDLRIISATDADLDTRFKAALKHRLGALEIVMPALRDHPEDIGELLLHFLQQSEQTEGRAVLPTADADPLSVALWAKVFYLCLQYEWPGNVRELANCAAQIVLASHEQVTLPPSVSKRLRKEQGRCEHGRDQPRAPANRTRPMSEVSDREFGSAMQDHAFEIAKVAAGLGVSRSAVYRRIRASNRFRLVQDLTERELHGALRVSGGDSAAAARLLQVSLSGLRVRLRHSGNTEL